MRIETLSPEAAEMPPVNPFGFESMRIEDIAKQTEQSLSPQNNMEFGIGTNELPMPPLNLSNAMNEMIMPSTNMGIENIPTPPTLNTMPFQIPDLSTILNTFNSSDLTNESGIGESGPIGVTSTSTSGIEDMLVKNQETKMPSLGDAYTSLQKTEMPNASEMMVGSEMAMNNIDLEPIGSKIESSIQGLSSTLSTQKETPVQTISTNSGGISPDVATELLNILRKIDSTLSGQSNTGGGSSVNTTSGGISEMNARAIGRQIANELKGSLARLYN
jgi:hypothetical protein